jgi:hypothetical protein
VYNNETDIPVGNTSARYAGPGKRWRHSMVTGDVYYESSSGYYRQPMAIFGGHRLWHGYLWIYSKYLDYSYPGQSYKTAYATWRLMPAKTRAYNDPGLSWATRLVN